MGRIQHETNLKPKRRSNLLRAPQRPLLVRAHLQNYLPEPASLQEGEGAAQQLQKDVPSVEDLQEGNERNAKDGIEKELMYMDVQHAPAVEVVEEEKTCQNKDGLQWKNRRERWSKNMYSPSFFFPLQVRHECYCIFKFSSRSEHVV